MRNFCKQIIFLLQKVVKVNFTKKKKNIFKNFWFFEIELASEHESVLKYPFNKIKDVQEPDSPFSIANSPQLKNLNKIDHNTNNNDVRPLKMDNSPKEQNFHKNELKLAKMSTNQMILPKNRKSVVREDLIYNEFETLKSYSGYFEEGNLENVINKIMTLGQSFQKNLVFRRLKSNKSKKNIYL